MINVRYSLHICVQITELTSDKKSSSLGCHIDEKLEVMAESGGKRRIFQV